MNNKNPIIVALDGMTIENAGKLAHDLAGLVWGFKLNDLFTRHGPDAVRHIGAYGNIMLDCKWYDIPATVANHAKAAMQSCLFEKSGDKIQIATVHAHGGIEMMKAAVKEMPGKIAAVTILTSFDACEYRLTHGLDRDITIGSQVQALATLAEIAGCSYMVCSGKELELVKDIKLQKIVPGIRPAWHNKADDQKRTMTPKEAISLGAEYLVIGRPITEAKNPVEAVKLTLEEIGA
jgi:orotidine-5'-phosphate decarboxylase